MALLNICHWPQLLLPFFHVDRNIHIHDLSWLSSFQEDSLQSPKMYNSLLNERKVWKGNGISINALAKNESGPFFYINLNPNFSPPFEINFIPYLHESHPILKRILCPNNFFMNLTHFCLNLI